MKTAKFGPPRYFPLSRRTREAFEQLMGNLSNEYGCPSLQLCVDRAITAFFDSYNTEIRLGDPAIAKNILDAVHNSGVIQLTGGQKLELLIEVENLLREVQEKNV